MTKHRNLTLKRIRDRHAEYPEDTELHEEIEKGGSVKKLKKLVKKSTDNEPFDRKS